MHILVTDATSAVGRTVARQLIAAGHTVAGIAERPHAWLDAGVEFVRAPLTDPVLQELTEDADAVVHLAPLDTTAPGGTGIGGVARVTHAAARAGARLLFVSQAAGLPAQYRPAEELVSTSWAPSLVVRIAPPLGRHLDWMVCRTVATLLRHTKASAQPIRVLHQDDLVRFLITALSTDRTGVVDLAAPGTTNMITAWRLLRGVDPRLRLHGVRNWPDLLPEIDIAAIQEDWNFDFGFQALDAVVDTCRGMVGRKLGAAGAVSRGSRLPLPLEALPRPWPADELRNAAPDGLEGEFDDRIDPRFPVFSAAGLTEALPGPLTPITLDVQLSGLRAAGRVMGQALALGGVIGAEWDSRAIAVFGHRPYVGVSANVVAAAQLPGWDQQAVARAVVNQPQVGDLLPFGEPRVTGGAVGSVAKIVAAARSLAMMRNLKKDTRAYIAAATAELLAAEQLAELPDAALEVRIRLIRDRIHQGWILTALWLINTGVTAATLDRNRAESSVSGIGEMIKSRRVAAEIGSLTTVLRANPTVLALAREGDYCGIRASSPHVAALVAGAVARIGHRGPGEVELASEVFGDDPGMLLTAAARAVTAPVSPTRTRRWVANARECRELAHDTTLRFTHDLRITLRELGSRRVAADLIDAADDLCYLTCDELVILPADARLRIKRRRAERERLQALHPPDVIDHVWQPAAGSAEYPDPGTR